MPRPANIIPSIKLTVMLPMDIHTAMSLELYSELEGRIPHGAYQRFLVGLIQDYFRRKGATEQADALA